MRKRIAACTCAFALILSGCGRLSNEYHTEVPYTIPVQENVSTDGKIPVSSLGELKQALLSLAYEGVPSGTLAFDPGYSGDIVADIASACWQVRTQDALCAYCVENIAYELTKIVTISEANIYISYSAVSENPKNIHTRSFASGIAPLIQEALRNGTPRLVMLIGRSSYDVVDMEDAVKSVYRSSPAITPAEPAVSVNMFSGTGAQRLYEINIGYGMQESERAARLEAMTQLNPFEGKDTEEMSAAQKAELAARWLTENCELSDSAADCNAYSALIEKKANSEGMSLAYTELCHRLGLDCRIVYGQRDWEEHCWNIVLIDDNYFHVDVSACITGPFDASFLKNDEDFWTLYRWDVSAYPKCSGLFLRPIEDLSNPQNADASDREIRSTEFTA